MNKIKTNGGIKLAEMIKNNKTIIELDVTDNYIFPQATVSIGEALKTNSTLITLSILMMRN